MKILNVKGCNDYLPKDQIVRNYINKTLEETFLEYGYLPIETPIICYYDILSGKYDDNNDILKEIYRLSDQGKRDLGLRYDLTVPFAKFIALNKNKISFPFKRYEISRVFRDGPIKLGRDREFTQCDVDVVGIDNQFIEAELLNLYISAFNKLDIDIDIKYNSRNLIRGLILSCNINEDLINKIITIIDKMNKISKKELQNLLLELGLDNNQINNLLSLFKLTLQEIDTKFINTNINTLRTGIDELKELEKYIKGMNIQNYCTFTPTLARGQEYYTGNVFEVYDKKMRITSSIGGGGRYNKMITDYLNDGNNYPAVGISFGLSSIYELVKMNEDYDIDREYDLYIIPMDTNITSLNLATTLRNNGLKVLIEMNKKKVSKALNWADKNNIPYVIVIGENEETSGKLVIRDMYNSTNIEVDMNDIDNIVKILNTRE